MKLSGTHSSLINLSKDLLYFLDGKVFDLKVSPGIIISKRSATARNQKIKVLESISGLDTTVTQNSTVQKLRVYTSDQALLISYIKDFCQNTNTQFSN